MALVRLFLIVSILRLSSAYSVSRPARAWEGLQSDVSETTGEPFGLSPSPVSEASLVAKLLENSRRMESMVVMLVDLKAVLGQAVSAEQSQMALRTEVVELREEISYLREEIQRMKAQQATEARLGLDSKLVNKIHNDETTIQWLKESLTEVRHGLAEVSSSINVTGLFQLKQEMETSAGLVSRDLEELQGRVQGLELDGARRDEAVLEIRGDVADLRAWQANAGRELISSDRTPTSGTESNEILPRFEKETDRTFRHKMNLLMRADEGKFPSRHNRKLRTMEKLLMGVMNDQSVLHRRLVRLEGDLAEVPLASKLSRRRGLVNRERRNSAEVSGDSLRLSSLEKSVADYSNTLEGLDRKVSALDSLRDSSRTLFTVLEALETKYDGRFNEVQLSLGRIETEVNGIDRVTDELKEQQSASSRLVQHMKKDLTDAKERVKTNHLRTASLQSQILEWGLKTCLDESSEAIQNIKITSLEAALRRT